MNDLDPDMVKLAVMPQSFSDVLSLMEASRNFADQNPMMPVISISMGEEGLLSRIAGEMTGSVITFGTEKEVSAPGQIPRKDLEEILRLIHKYA
jgi:3-dehydroquinate dehydratase-1